MTNSINIDGPAGRLEALWCETPGSADNSANPANTESATCCALLCHPHPQYGGSMHDGVLAIAADVLAANNIAHLRFNFRGVGASDGQFDNGQGESDDICAAWEWLSAQAHWDTKLLIGYSFGAATAWAARAGCQDLARLLLIAPPTQAMPFTGTTTGLATNIVVGDRDTYCDLNAMPDGASVQTIAGADHFFSGAAEALGDAISTVVAGTG